jgi:trans-aconitate methyltransferase
MSTAGRVPERLSWVAELLDPQSTDAVLELGCGNGTLAALLLPRLSRGHYLGIDRSSSAIAAAVWRNSDAVASGAASFRVLDIAKAELDRRYHRIVAVNLNLFWIGAAPELARLREWLAPQGRLYLAYQPPSADALIKIEAMLRQNLEREAYAVERVERAAMRPIPALCVIARVA